VQEIAGVLSRQSGQSIIEVWNEALSLHRVRYEMELLAGPKEADLLPVRGVPEQRIVRGRPLRGRFELGNLIPDRQ
jgi:hypothetical protein